MAATPSKTKITYALTGDALVATPGQSMPLATIIEIRTFDIPAWRLGKRTLAPRRRRCLVRPQRGSALLIDSERFLRSGAEDEGAAAYDAFVKALAHRVSLATPTAVIAAGIRPALWWIWAALLLAFLILAALAIVELVTAALDGRLLTKEALAVAVFFVVLTVMIVPIARLLPAARPGSFDASRRGAPRGGKDA